MLDLIARREWDATAAAVLMRASASRCVVPARRWLDASAVRRPHCRLAPTPLTTVPA